MQPQYQVENKKGGGGGCLAAMGLGFLLQAISLFLKHPTDSPGAVAAVATATVAVTVMSEAMRGVDRGCRYYICMMLMRSRRVVHFVDLTAFSLFITFDLL